MMIHSTDSKCPLLTVYHPWSQPWSAVIRYNRSNIERSLETVSRIYFSTTAAACAAKLATDHKPWHNYPELMLSLFTNIFLAFSNFN